MTDAIRVKQFEAKRHFTAGGSVLVAQDGHETTRPVTATTTTHNARSIGWDELVSMVDMWRNRHPNQRFYLIPTETPTTLSQLITATREAFHALVAIDEREGDSSERTAVYTALEATFAAHGLDANVAESSVDWFEGGTLTDDLADALNVTTNPTT